MQRNIVIIIYRYTRKLPFFLVILWIFSTYFRKILKCHVSWNSFSDSRVVPCGATNGTDWWTYRQTKIIVAFQD